MHEDDVANAKVGQRTTWVYELVPLLELPKVDLSKSVQDQLPNVWPLNGVVDLLVNHPMPSFFAYLVFLAIATGNLFAQAPLGRVVSIIGALLGLPSLVVCFSMLRYELVVVLIKTYDVWFFSVVSTVTAIAGSAIFHDARSSVLVVSWLSFFMSIFVDANLFAIRNIWISSAISTVCYILLAGTVTIGSVDNLRNVNVFTANGHVLPARAAVRDGLFSMIVLILRNLYRRYHHAIRKHKVAVDTSALVVHCVTFRCRLQYRALVGESDGVVELPDVVHTELQIPTTSPSLPRTMAQLQFAPLLGPVDVRQSLAPVPWLWRMNPQRDGWWNRWGQIVFQIAGGASFLIANAVIIVSLLSSPSANRTGMILGSAFALFLALGVVSTCIVTAHRRLLVALMTSFDFIYIAFQGVGIHLTLVDLCGWRPEVTVALATDLVWSTWMLCWDAVPPPARKRLGLTTAFAAFIGTGLVSIIILSVGIVTVILPPDAINDRVFFQATVLGFQVEFFVLTWYVSCATTIVSWAIRIMWRLWRASEVELVVLDGSVFFEKPSRSRGAAQRSDKRPGKTILITKGPSAIFPLNQ